MEAIRFHYIIDNYPRSIERPSGAGEHWLENNHVYLRFIHKRQNSVYGIYGVLCVNACAL